MDLSAVVGGVVGVTAIWGTVQGVRHYLDYRLAKTAIAKGVTPESLQDLRYNLRELNEPTG